MFVPGNRDDVLSHYSWKKSLISGRTHTVAEMLLARVWSSAVVNTLQMT